MRLSKWLFLSSSIVLGAMSGYVAAYAQGEGVMDRPRPDYDPVGITAGAFRLLPAVNLALVYDDNVYRTATATRSDTIFEIAPELNLNSNWTRHMLNLRAGLRHYEHLDETSESRTDWDLAADGRLDIVRGAELALGLSHSFSHEPRSSPELVALAAEPTPFDVTRAYARLRFQPVRFGIEAGVTYDLFDYDPTELVGGLPSLSNDDRDREVVQVHLQADYEFSPGYTAFLRGTYDSRSFDQAVDRSGVDRSSDGYRVDAGIALLVTRLIRGQLYAGYLAQNYDPPLGDISGFDFGAALDWYPTELFTVHINASRVLTDTTIIGASARDDSQIAVSADWELLRNLLVRGGVGYIDSEFQGTARQDEYFDAHLAVTYLVNRYIHATGSYVYSDRTSSVPGQDFSDNLLALRMRLQL